MHAYRYLNDTKSLIERSDGMVIPATLENTDYRLLAESGTAIAPYVPPVPSVPTSVSKAQAQMALFNAGLLDQLEEAVSAHPYRPVRIWYESANAWDRSNPYVSAMAAELGLTDAQIDALFVAAAKL